MLTPVSRRIAEMVNRAPDPQQPYVGTSAFAHKAGLHASALARQADAYEHIRPGASATAPASWSRRWPGARPSS